ncbi:magnesium transporter [Schlesneria sp. T3-172]|uniref:magnesium transporter n=1 Tax=Schlesneria sphaerica TaxID=3373610 RepID=UPI0037C719B3
MLCKLMLPEIRELIENRDGTTLSEALDMWQPADIAELFADLSDADQKAAFRLLHGPQRTLIFEYLDRPTQHMLLESLEPADAGALFNDMSADDRTALLEELDEADREKHLQTLSAQQQAIARSLLHYPEDSVGRLMTPDFVAVRPNWTVEHVLEHVRRHGQDSESLNVVYVVDHDMHLIDDLRIRQILIAPVHITIERLMDSNYVALQATDLKRSAIEVFRRYDRTALPVLDEHHKLVGIVTIDDVLDVAEQAATEDAQKFGGLEALSEPYASTPLFTMVHKRATWLVILFLGELLTATVMGYFEHQLDQAVVLALFIPLIISSGGNSGSQAATLIVRALAVGEIRLVDWMKVFRREVISGSILGLLLGSIGFLRIATWSLFSDVYGEHWALVGMAVSLSLVAIVLWGSLIGSMLPFALKRLGLDPATSSAPFVATFVDVTGLLIYFSISIVVLGGTLLKN